MSSYYEKILATGEVKCIDEEIPFEIPQGWEWCRLGTIAEIIGGYAFPSLMLKGDTGTRVIRISDFTEHGLTKSRIVRYNGVAISDLYTIQISDILMAMTGGTVGKSCYIKSLPEKLLLNQRVAVIRNQYMNSEYINLIVESPHIIAFVNDRKNSTNDNISMKDIYNFLIPIPSIKQQERIVNAFNSIRPIIKRFAQVQENKEKLQNEVKDKLRKSILHEAIQGKLVPQISEEGTAQDLLQVIKEEKQKLFKEGKLKKSALNDSVIFRSDDNKYCENLEEGSVCIDDEIPFDIPANWAWVRLDDICSFIHRGKSPKYSLIKKYPVVAQKCNQWSGFSLEKAKFVEPQSISSYKEEYLLQDEDLMWNSTGLGTLGRMAIYYKKLNPYELAVADSHVTVIRPYKQYVVSEYLYYYFASNTVQSVIEDKSDGSTKQKELSTKTVKSYLVPLPPMEEQKRIIEKVEELTQLLK